MCCLLQRAFDTTWMTLHSGGRVTNEAADAVVRKHQELLQSIKDAPRHRDRDWWVSGACLMTNLDTTVLVSCCGGLPSQPQVQAQARV